MGEPAKDASSTMFTILLGPGMLAIVFFPRILVFAFGAEQPWFVEWPVFMIAIAVYLVVAEAVAAYVVGRFFPRWELAFLYGDQAVPAAVARLRRGIRRLFEIGRAQSRAKS